MNAERVPFEALKERSGVCFGGFRPMKHVEGPRALARGAPLLVFFQEEPHGTSPPPNYIKNKDLTPSPFTTIDLDMGREIAG